MSVVLTYSYRMKGSQPTLTKWAKAVNIVWNYCNETSHLAIRRDQRWLSGFELCSLLKGCSAELGVLAQTAQAVAQEYAKKRKITKSTKLKWRGRKSLSWVPFTNQKIKLFDDSVTCGGNTFRFWKSRELEGRIKCGSFNQDARGRWYVNFVCEVETHQTALPNREIGVDLGCKDQLVCSDGAKYSRGNLTNKYADKLASAQRANKKKQTRNLHAKIANSRKDWNHKVTTDVVKSSSLVVVGDIGTKNLMKTRMAKSLSDAGHGYLKSMLAYKAIRHHVDYAAVKENGTTVTCSTCLEKTGPSGLSGLSVREWTCSSCGAVHDRDVNSAKNILRLGHQTLIQEPGSPGDVKTGNWSTPPTPDNSRHS